MPIGFDTLNCVVSIETEMIQNLLIDGVIQWHKLFLREQALWCLIFELLVPGVLSYLFNVVALCRVNFKDFGDEMGTIS